MIPYRSNHKLSTSCGVWLFAAMLLSGLLLFGVMLPVSHAQVTTDGTLGTVVTPIPLGFGDTLFEVTNGTIVSSNQFLSLTQLNLANAFDILSLPDPVVNHLVRVTAGGGSFINGTVETFGNLYLMDPSGIRFGADAFLDIGSVFLGAPGPGSFFATTADFLELNGGVLFNAATTAAELIAAAPLTISPVDAFGFLGGPGGSITVEDFAFLEVPLDIGTGTGQTLGLIAENIDINPDALVSAPSGNIELAAIGLAEGVVTMTGAGAFPEITATGTQGTVTMSDFSLVDVTDVFFDGDGHAGTVVIRGGKLIVDGGAIFADTIGNVDGASPGIDINVEESITLTNFALLATSAGQTGRAGDVRISTSGTMLMDVESSISSETFGAGSSGNISLDVGTLTLSGEGTLIFNTTDIGPSGEIMITAQTFNVQDGGIVETRTFGSGLPGDLRVITSNLNVTSGGNIRSRTITTTRAGDIFVTATESFLLSGQNAAGRSGIRTLSTAAGGPTGNITVAAGSGAITGGARIGGDIISGIQAGTIDVTVTDTLDISGQDLSGFPSAILNVSSTAGPSGVLNVTAGTLNLTDGALVQSLSTGTGEGGGVNITGTTAINMSGDSSIASIAAERDVGDVTVTTPSLQMDNSSITATTSDKGAAGKIIVEVGSLDLSNNARIDTSSTAAAPIVGGNAGDIGVTTTGNTATLSSGSIISSSTTSSGNAGNVVINSPALTMDDATIATSTTTTGTAGNITANVGTLTMTNNSSIDSSSTGTATGNAGTVLIEGQASPANFVRLTDSSITTEASLADGGNVKLDVAVEVALVNSSIETSVGNPDKTDTVGGNISIDPQFVILQNSQILANAFAGTGGNITIVATQAFLADANSVVDASSQLGISGEVTINSPLSNLSEVVVPLESSALQAAALLMARCAAKLQGGRSSSFVQVGRDSLPPEPGGWLPSPLLALGETGTALAKASSIGQDGIFSAPALSADTVQLRRFRHLSPLAGLFPRSRTLGCG